MLARMPYLALLTLAISCGGHKSTHKKTPDVVNQALVSSSTFDYSNLKSSTDNPQILGHWWTYCHSDARGSGSRSLSVYETHAMSTFALGSQDNCSAQTAYYVSKIFEYDYKASLFKQRLQKSMVRPFSNQAAADLNATQACGLDSWADGVEVDVTEKDCSNAPFAEILSANTRGAESTFSFTVEADGLEYRKLTYENANLRHFIDLDEVHVPSLEEGTVTPIDQLFLGIETQKVEKILKDWGCVISREAGISDCKRPRDAKEAEPLHEAMNRLLFASYDEAALKTESERVAVRYGYRKQLQILENTNFWREALRQQLDSWSNARKKLPELGFSTWVWIGPLKQKRAYDVIIVTADLPGFREELDRLNIIGIQIGLSPGLRAQPDHRATLEWNYLWSNDEALAFLKTQPTPAQIP